MGWRKRKEIIRKRYSINEKNTFAGGSSLRSSVTMLECKKINV
jgi:hypothetical protein